ncbi:MAG: ChaN family lipoprotein [Bdellovibrionales bacterium]
MKSLILVLILNLFFSFQSLANTYENGIYNGRSLETKSVFDLIDSVLPGDVLILGEFHGVEPHHRNQNYILQQLAKRHSNLSVGMEFINFQQQEIVDQYFEGELTEEDFLQRMKWDNFKDYHFYRDLIAKPYLFSTGKTYGINAPRELTSKVAKTGLDSLNEKERALLPPNFNVGSDLYLGRFREAMGGHVPEEKLLKYFTAQSIWDDTMAYQILRHQKQNEVFVVIVGDFHASYGGGLKDRLVARGKAHEQIKILSQISRQHLYGKTIEQMLNPRTMNGPRGDFIYITD